MDTKKIKVSKVSDPPSSHTIPTNEDLYQYQTNITSMPQMYLELLENKDKIKQSLLNKEYDPTDTVSEISYFQKKMETPRFLFPKQDIPTSATLTPPQQQSSQQLPTRNMVLSPPQSPTSSWKSGASTSLHQKESHRMNVTHTHEDDENDEDEDDDEDGSYEEEQTNQIKSNPTHHYQEPENDDEEDDESFYSDDSRSVPTDQQQPSSDPQPEYTRRQVPGDVKLRYQKMVTPSQPTVIKSDAPRLSELERMGQVKTTNVLPDVQRLHTQDQEKEDELKRELLFKFDVLRKAYKHVDIPQYTMHTDLKHLSRSYENTLRRVTLDTSVESYKSYMIGGFMLMEFVLNQWFSLDMQGFTQQQMLNMTQYERLFIELGEKSYTPGGSPWPVELRILLTVFMNAVIFAISKTILKKTGNNVMNMMNTVQSSSPPTSSFSSDSTNPIYGNSQLPARRKMQGPSIDLEQLPIT